MAPPAFSEDDRHFMRVALSLSKRGLGNVWPNPSVGCVLVSPEGVIVGRGNTRPGGRPHAERVALDMAGEQARGATAYVTLEPCSHFGKSPPCAAGLIEAGVARVVSALTDPDNRVSGRGHKMLSDAGIKVDVGLFSDEARKINEGFLSRIEKGRPFVALKLASTMDARSATKSGESQWITGSAAREEGHLLRASHDAILVGAKTVLADDPTLTCRLPGRGHHSPVRVILDRIGDVSPSAKLILSADDVPTWLVTADSKLIELSEKFEKTSVKVIAARCAGDHLDLHDVMQKLGDAGLTRVLVETGGNLAAGLLNAQLVDRIIHFVAPSVLGAEGKAMVAELGIEKLSDMPRFTRTSVRSVGEDIAVTYDFKTE
ncbi:MULTISPECIES: bifunctional diaminohydroxyphosphoribosylaminopyrimidine deaminase/5-amino-6-(5-phosphoribosylamino)uracil reductase RibD [Thalassospira]|uniref:Riboflavin biosynthesis protein RibD n=2 Tax=Thalassospira TaxID=168934 RepID=A0A367W6R0_9PROT|nr:MULTISPECIES: bifunctional diaminohydroxyphosphoribosylaminopyrimidine deaminase/5-amino-6-(5-phosphoribosylamino)uracil reductase RibD [Thalassospira]MDG4719659.1 bifunctional diaminohydroxyphosphoribosylaminopyrimidine deaminase/5-amino-6-(5-phosphoribosylamino)uracil reductase RibD [Thalassospira sp. FZY0004]RCK36301.1 5-amino-6-(5-phosphoribosylamino)uracil reductase [Thalassospira profundimaris]